MHTIHNFTILSNFINTYYYALFFHAIHRYNNNKNILYYNSTLRVYSRMLSNYVKGINAEAKVVDILISYCYEILGRRVRTKYGEIDILAFKDNTVVAVEVKQRKTLNIARECLTNKQMHRISKALQLIIYERNLLFENYRIDVVLLDRIGNYEYIINAFSFEADTDI